MKPWLFMRIFFLTSSVSYHFGFNFGQVFKDRSGNNYYGINGDSQSTDSFDTVPTDRGAYFSGSSFIQSPPNSLSSSSTSLSSPFSFVVWSLSEDQEGIILLHQKDSSNYIIVKRSTSKNLGYRLKSASFDSSMKETASNSFPDKTWKLIFMSYSSSTINIYIGKTLSSSLTLTSSYSESGTFDTFLGKAGLGVAGYKGFIFYFELSNSLLNYLDFIGTASSTCLVVGCKSCTESVKDVYFTKEGCLSKEMKDDKNSNGDGCGKGCKNYGCDSSKTCLECKCSYGSCSMVSKTPTCLCPESATASATSCKCPDKFYYQFDSCLACLLPCATCLDGSSCETCVALNAFLNGDKICACKNGYFSVNFDLNTADACQACFSECSSCNQDKVCTACKALNSKPSSVKGCVCDEGFYGSNLVSANSCIACHSDCQTCSQSNLCLTCKNPSKIPSSTSGCTCSPEAYLSSGDCYPCNSACSSCDNGTTCILCKDPNAVPSSSGCECKSGYGLAPSNICLICSTECTSCDGSYLCNSCKDINAIPNNDYSCDCKEKFFKSDSSCLACHSSCKTCESNLTCSQCSSTFAEISSGTCRCLGNFFNLNGIDDEPDCRKCHETCKTCIDDNSCLTCWDENSFKNSSGFCFCNKEFFLDSESHECINCHETCETCLGPSQFECLTCKFVKFFNSCLDECPLDHVLLDFLCIPVENNETIMEFKFLDVGISFRDFVHGFIAEQVLEDEGKIGVSNVYQRGVFFDGSDMLRVNISGILLIGSSFCITVWVKPLLDSFDLFVKDSLIRYFLEQGKVSAEVFIGQQVVQIASQEELSQKWMHFYFSIEFSINTQSKLIIDNLILAHEVLSTFYYIDQYSKYIFLGGSPEKNRTFSGFLYDFKLFSKVIPLESLITECPNCSICTKDLTCLPDCSATEYFDEKSSSCKKCPSKCPTFCKNSKNCNLCDDENCLNCENYNSKTCTLCKKNFELNNGTCSKCEDSSYFDLKTRTCQSCPDLCLTCSSASECLTCAENSELDSVCVCETGYEFQGNCSRRLFSAGMKVSSNNLANLSFSEPLGKSLSVGMITAAVNDKMVKFSLKEVSLSEYHLKVVIRSVETGDLLQVEFLEDLESSNKSLLETKKLTGKLTKTQEMIKNEALEEKGQKSHKTAKLTSIIFASIICFLSWTYLNPFIMFEFFNSSEMIYAVYFFNLDLNPVLSEFLMGMKVIKYIPTPFSLMSPLDLGQPTTKKLEKYGFERNLIILNLGLHLTIFFTCSVSMVVLSLLSPRYKEKFRKSLKFGFFLRFWIQANFEMMLAATFGIIFSKKEGSLEIFDYFLAVFVIFVHCFSCFFLMFLLVRRARMSDEGEIALFVEKYSTFFEDFKENSGSRLFYFSFVVRRMILIILIQMIDLPSFQLAIHLVMSLAISIYVGMTRCFKSSTQNFFHVVNELIISSYICVVFASQVENSLMDSFSGSYVCVYLIFTVWAFAFVIGVYSTGFGVWDSLKNCINKMKNKKTSLKYRNQTSPDIETRRNKDSSNN